MNSITYEMNDQEEWKIIEKTLATGDLRPLTPQQRVLYYNKTCESLGLNPLTRPFSYIELKAKKSSDEPPKLILYAGKDCCDQLRKINSVSIYQLDSQMLDGNIYLVRAYARTKDGREDISTGTVPLVDYYGKKLAGEALANAYLKCETKAKRRVTLSICGLGFLDETEVESILAQEKSEEAQLSISEKSKNKALSHSNSSSELVSNKVASSQEEKILNDPVYPTLNAKMAPEVASPAQINAIIVEMDLRKVPKKSIEAILRKRGLRSINEFSPIQAEGCLDWIKDNYAIEEFAFAEADGILSADDLKELDIK